MIKLPRSSRLSFFLTGIFLGIFFLLRLSFWKYFESSNAPLSSAVLLHSFFIGLKMDLRLSLLLTLPLFLFGWIKRISPFHSRSGRRFWCSYFAITAFVVFLLYVVDFAYFAYVHARLDDSILNYLEDARISLRMVWETYPVLTLIASLLLLTSFSAAASTRLILKLTPDESEPLSRRKQVLLSLLYLFLVTGGIYGKFSFYPLRWSDAFFSTDTFASAVALNPVLYFFDSLRAGGLRIDERVVREHYDEIADYLAVGIPDKEHLNFSRKAKGGRLPGRPNVVLIQLEAFSYYKTGLYGSPLDSTPYFDAITRTGILFTRFYTPHWGTARGVFASITGIPDVETHNTSTRNPAVICQQTIVNAFAGYEKFYFLGGSASWGNIRGILSYNIPGLRIFEEGSYQSSRINVWGISDLSLFEEANEVFRRQQDPFFAIIQTAGNHPPYTFPSDNEGFQWRDLGSDTLRRNGFPTVEEWNAIRFLDHSIGKFLEMARRERYFQNTVFVFYGDHGTGRNGGDYTPKFESELDLTAFHVPFLIYAPYLIPQGQRYDKVGSLVDVLPTVAGLASGSYANSTLGRDLLDPQFDSKRYAFIIVHGKGPQIGILNDQFYFTMHSDGSAKTLYQLKSDSPQRNVQEHFPESAAILERLLRGIYETSKYMLSHSCPE